MIALVAALGLSPEAGVAGAAAAWLGAGAAVGLALRRRGVEPATVASALAVWPLLLPLLDPGPDAPRGPLAPRIDAAARALEEALAHPSARDLEGGEELDDLRAALTAADQRLALADRLLADAGGPGANLGALAELREARRQAEEELVAVLEGMTELRLRIGLVALAGQRAPVGGTLRRWRDRLAALDEVAGLAPGPVRRSG